MPKKTKRQKILAERRRVVTQTESIPSSSFSYQVTETPIVSTSGDVTELAIIQHDLVRTIIFAFIAIAIEVGIYWKINGMW
jgi:hypothetical protein